MHRMPGGGDVSCCRKTVKGGKRHVRAAGRATLSGYALGSRGASLQFFTDGFMTPHRCLRGA